MNSITLLVIDDNPDDRLLYRRTLQKSTDDSYSMLEAQNGEEGLALLETEIPHCILLDYSLPGRNGIEVLKRIRGSHPFVPVVMLTGQGNEKVAVAAMQQGAQNYIAKSSITLETLEHVIRMAIEHCMLQKRIQDQQDSLEVFSHALAHDLKEPVRTIRSFVELLEQREQMSDKARNYFHYIHKAAERMHSLIDTVFLYTRLSDPSSINLELCDMRLIVKEVKENLHRLIRERGATFTEGALPTIYANRIQMIQLLQNLFSNAIKHSEKPVNIHIKTCAQGDDWLFSVSDNGAGIDPTYFKRIFQPFKRLSGIDNQGTGLGLAICEKIVTSHGGKIWCESPAGEGATFKFALPRALPLGQEEPARVQQSCIDDRCAPEKIKDKPLANVLLVDDNRADIEMTRFRLLERSQLKCNLLVAGDGAEALASLRAGIREGAPIDLLLLDINMPQMNGFELLECIRKDKQLKDTMVVMCTGSIYDKDMERARTLGVVGYITKPVEFDKLKEILEHHEVFQLCPADEGYKLMRAA